MNNQEIKINFGCLTINEPGWINIDNALRHILIGKIPGLPFLLFKFGKLSKVMYEAHKKGGFKNVKYGDVRKKLRFEEDSVAIIYHSHLLEHLSTNAALSFLKECFRILKRGGLMRVVVPDLEYFANKYVQTIKSGKNPKMERDGLMSVFFDDDEKKFLRYGHRWAYDSFSLRELLEKAGFSKIRFCKYKEGKCPDIEKLDVIPASIFAEAEK